MVRILGGKYAGLEFNEEEMDLGSQQNTKIQLVNKYIARANNAIDVLNRAKAGVVSRSTTPL
jgi:hypothetical protein